MTPPVIVQRVPIVVIVFGLTRLRTSHPATGSMTRRYPAWISSQTRRMPLRMPLSMPTADVSDAGIGMAGVGVARLGLGSRWRRARGRDRERAAPRVAAET